MPLIVVVVTCKEIPNSTNDSDNNEVSRSPYVRVWFPLFSFLPPSLVLFLPPSFSHPSLSLSVCLLLSVSLALFSLCVSRILCLSLPACLPATCLIIHPLQLRQFTHLQKSASRYLSSVDSPTLRQTIDSHTDSLAIS